MKKIKWLILVVICTCVGMLAENQRLKDDEYESLVKIAERQAVEIAVIEQASRLRDYKKQMMEAQKKINRVAPIADPKDVIKQEIIIATSKTSVANWCMLKVGEAIFTDVDTDGTATKDEGRGTKGVNNV